MSEAYMTLYMAENQYLRDSGWTMVTDDTPDGGRVGDWTPPENPRNYWDRDRALAHQKHIDEQGCA